MKVVDLSQPITAGMQVFPGDPFVNTMLAATLSADGFQVAELHLGTHSGTHVDAPLHTVTGGAAVDELELAQLHGPALVVRAESAGRNATVEWSDVEDQLRGVRPGTIVLFSTGWSRHFGTAMYLEHPVLSADIASRLLGLGVSVIGVDTLNPDRTLPAEPGAPLELPVHAVILGAGGAIVENLTNLDAVTWPDPLFSALPLRLAGLDGSPVRAVAILP